MRNTEMFYIFCSVVRVRKKRESPSSALINEGKKLVVNGGVH